MRGCCSSCRRALVLQAVLQRLFLFPFSTQIFCLLSCFIMSWKSPGFYFITSLLSIPSGILAGAELTIFGWLELAGTLLNNAR
jgi:hypothetical protein